MDEEQALIRRCQSGDIKAFEPLFRAHLHMAVRTAFLIVRDWAIAEDAAQEAFVRAFERIRTFQPGQPFAPWLYRIAVNEALRLAGKSGRQPLAEAIPDEMLVANGASPEEVAVVQERRRALWTAIRLLHRDQRAVVVLKYFNHFSEAEIATVLGLPQSTVKSRLYEGRQRLAERLSQWKEVMP